jgi:VWFA-related protein
MKFFRAVVAVAIVSLSVKFVTAVAAQQHPPTFRGGVDLIGLDVSVLDKDRQPVRGLTAADFTVTIDGQTQQISAFKAVDIPPPPVSDAATWLRAVAPDVVTNTHPPGRVVAILIDDGSFAQREPETSAVYVRQKARAIAREAIDALGPDDLAAVIFTENNHAAQNFTHDRARLLAAIGEAGVVPGTNVMVQVDGSSLTESQAARLDLANCYSDAVQIEAVERVAQALQSLPQQRKILLYVSVGHAIKPVVSVITREVDPCNVLARDAMNAAFRAAQLANVTIEAVDVEGLVVGQVGHGPNQDPFGNKTTLKVEFLRTMAETTGGRAIVNSNDMERGVRALLDESASYYYLGVERPAARRDGEFHPIRVRVNRPGLDVRTRKGFYEPTRKAQQALAARLPRPIDRAITAALPQGDFPLAVSVAPFAAGQGQAELAVVLNVLHPHVAGSAASAPERVTLGATAFNPETGDATGTWRQEMNVTWNSTSASNGEFEFLWRLPVRQSARYEYRLAVETAGGQSSSVYTYADIPNFAKEPLSLSGLAVLANPRPKVGPAEALSGLTPAPPTARRVFRGTDTVRAFVRIYEGGTKPLVPLTITTRLLDANDQQIGSGSRQVDPPAFSTARSFDYVFEVPLRVPSGEYLLIIDVSAGNKRVQRALRYHVE